ncbi:hypothetical protein [Planctomyces sp. SH-PL14]|uniref:hypothetical protein n=1 Tax=Planctomyces sp. SH-PL14 TaxID=1632864 RepID=UPI00078C8DB9|nr:hypothetical protein [Planctomyces sp. SH-PL14]AMV18893.1 hypothetical protein VT03_13470 [Planctomyces sp. SH-PL14]
MGLPFGFKRLQTTVTLKEKKALELYAARNKTSVAQLMREFAERGGLKEVLINIDKPYERETRE